MLLRDKLINVGTVFFKYRSHIPLGLIVIMLLERRHFYVIKSPYYNDAFFELTCFLVVLSGCAIRAHTTGHCRSGTSGRNTKGQYADSLNTDGLYSIMRNPLYAGNFFIILGLSMLSQSYEVVLINILLFTGFYIPIILVEEHFLIEKFKDTFMEYAKYTPAILPNPKLWKKPELKFNFARYLAREHDSFLGIIAVFFFIELLKNYTLENKISFDAGWVFIIAITLIVWSILKIMKKYLKGIDKGR